MSSDNSTNVIVNPSITNSNTTSDSIPSTSTTNTSENSNNGINNTNNTTISQGDDIVNIVQAPLSSYNQEFLPYTNNNTNTTSTSITNNGSPNPHIGASVSLNNNSSLNNHPYARNNVVPMSPNSSNNNGTNFNLNNSNSSTTFSFGLSRDRIPTHLQHYMDTIHTNTQNNSNGNQNNNNNNDEDLNSDVEALSNINNGNNQLALSNQTNALALPSAEDENAIVRTGQNYVDISEYLMLPQSEAAKRLNIPTSTLSKRWKEAAQGRKWPFRKVNKLDKEIMTLLHNIPPGGQCPPAVEESLAKLMKKRQKKLTPVNIRF